MATEIKNVLVAAASVDNGGGGAGTSRFSFSNGFSAVAHTGAGVYTLTFEALSGYAVGDVIIALGANVATASFLSFHRTVATTIVVRSWDQAGFAKDDVPFDIAVFKNTP